MAIPADSSMVQCAASSRRAATSRGAAATAQAVERVPHPEQPRGAEGGARRAAAVEHAHRGELRPPVNTSSDSTIDCGTDAPAATATAPNAMA
jgi:hypothetical protein